MNTNYLLLNLNVCFIFVFSNSLINPYVQIAFAMLFFYLWYFELLFFSSKFSHINNIILHLYCSTLYSLISYKVLCRHFNIIFLETLFNINFNYLKFFWTIKVLFIDPSLGEGSFFNSKLSTIGLWSDKFVVRILHFSVLKILPWAVSNNQFHCVIYLLQGICKAFFIKMFSILMVPVAIYNYILVVYKLMCSITVYQSS